MPAFERRYVADYMLAKWPEGGYQMNVPLGPIPTEIASGLGYEAAARIYRPFRPEVDAIKYFEGGLIIIEAKVFKTMDAMAKLRWYGELVGSTEELRPWWGKANQLRLVTPRITALLTEMARASGVEVDVFVTDHVLAQAQKYERYWTREYREERARKKAMRAALGLD